MHASVSPPRHAPVSAMHRPVLTSRYAPTLTLPLSAESSLRMVSLRRPSFLFFLFFPIARGLIASDGPLHKWLIFLEPCTPHALLMHSLCTTRCTVVHRQMHS